MNHLLVKIKVGLVNFEACMPVIARSSNVNIKLLNFPKKNEWLWKPVKNIQMLAVKYKPELWPQAGQVWTFFERMFMIVA